MTRSPTEPGRGVADLVALTGEPRLPMLAKLGLVIEILASYLAIRRRLQDEPMPRLLAWIRAAPPRRWMVDPPGLRPGRDLRLGRAVVITLEATPFDSRCLMRSLVLLRLLARRGRGAELIIAVSEPRADRVLSAHAWLEQDGTALLWPGDPGLARLTVL